MLQRVNGMNPIMTPIQKNLFLAISQRIRIGMDAITGIKIKNVFIMKPNPIHTPEMNKNILFFVLIDFISANIPTKTTIIPQTHQQHLNSKQFY